MEMKFKKKNRQNQVASTCIAGEPSERSEGKTKKTLRVLARLLELKGKFWFVASEQKRKSLVTDLQKWRHKTRAKRLPG